MTIIEHKSLADANETKALFVSLGYKATVNVNHAALINSPTRTDNLFLVVVEKI